MIEVCVNNQTDYRVNATEIKNRLNKFLMGKGLTSALSVEVTIVGNKEMMEIARFYLNEEGVVHNVLSFSEADVKGRFVYPRNEIPRLGDIIVCYPKARQEAKVGDVLIAERLYYLIEHGARHLVGEHHK